MPRTGSADLPLHGGAAPQWLFRRMTLLAREIALFIISDAGRDELLRKLSDPFWFQAFGCVLGFDWHSSGVTTTSCGALKEGLKPVQKEIGVFICGGKGRVSRNTPQEIEEHCGRVGRSPTDLVYASRMSAKVDSSAVQDGYQVYHHCFMFTDQGRWCVVQQGMNEADGTARRYHWLSEGVKDFVCEPHVAICCERRAEGLNMVAQESRNCRDAIATLVREKPELVAPEIDKALHLALPGRHPILLTDISRKRLKSILLAGYERRLQDFAGVLAMPGVGAKTVRALSLVAEVIYGAAPSFRDPARFSYAHGGKDGYPYPVDRSTYDLSIAILHKALARAKVGDYDKMRAVKRLSVFESFLEQPTIR